MAIEFQNQFLFGEFIDDPIVEQVYLITTFIKTQDYYSAYGIMTQNNLSIENVISKTQTLKNKDLVKFVDFVISQKR